MEKVFYGALIVLAIVIGSIAYDIAQIIKSNHNHNNGATV